MSRGMLRQKEAGELLRDLQRRLLGDLRRIAVELNPGSDALFAKLPPSLTSWYDLQLLEHLLCEAYKLSHGHDLNAYRPAHTDVQYRALLRKAFPEW